MRVKFLSVFLALVFILGLLPACSKPEEDDGEKPLTGYDDEADLSAPSADDEDYIYLHDRDYQSLSDMRAQLQFDYISGGDILDAYAEQGEAAQSHPRVFVDSDKLQSLREEMETSERLQSLYSSVKRRADEVLNLATPTYDDNDPDRLTAVHTYGPGLMDAAFYYTLNPDRANKESEAYTKYFQKSLEYVKVICNFKDWHIVHALDTFVATASIGIYYDVMYEYLSEEDRTLIRNAIIDKGILPYISSAASEVYTASNEDELIGAAGNHWSTYVNNWNGVCNGGFLTGALAIFGDDTSKISNEVLSRAMAKSWNNTSHLIRSYYPDGVSEEGYMYWEYALMYLELGWLGFDNMLGTTFGWMDYEVMEKIAYGSMYESGPVVGSNVGDDTVKTNPSSTRISLAYLLDKGDVQQYRLFNGNETGILLLHFILTMKRDRGLLQGGETVIKTIVTTDTAFRIAEEFGVRVKEVLTGFKYIGEQIDLLPRPEQYVFGLEESYGYLVGVHARDKDAVSASMLIAEMAAYYAKQGKTLIDALYALYDRYGYMKTALYSKEYKGKDGKEAMNGVIRSLRNAPPAQIGGRKVERVLDYLNGIDGLPVSDVLSYSGQGFKVIVRPSGTEPKLKAYFMAEGEDEAQANALLSEVQENFCKIL